MNVESVRQLIAESRPSPRCRGYPESVREAVLDVVRQLRAEGHTWGRISETLGLCKATIRAWAVPTPAFLPVVIKEDFSHRPAGPGLELRSPNGFVVSGLSPFQAAQLLREVG